MSSVVYLVVCVGLLWAGYRWYGTAFERFLGVDPSRPTPATSRYDGVDYVPAKHWIVLFGHHFSAIAGAGPIIGPVIAVSLWGWAPTTLFVIIGSLFIGGIHDFGSLFMSVRHDGKSIADISEEAVSKRARLIFSWFVLLALVVVVAVFVYFCAETFVVEPKIVLPSVGLIPVALLVGLMMYRMKVNTAVSTATGLILLVALTILGELVPVAIPPAYAMLVWVSVLLGYCFLASILPVNILLQPRDYLSSYLLFFGIAAGFLGVFTAHPTISYPAYIGWESHEGAMWPLLFVTVACGAISGFHSLVSAGTSCKQIASESDTKKIGYGAMVVEAVVAVIAIVAIIGTYKTPPLLHAALAKGGPVNAFAQGFGNLTRFLFGKYGVFVAMMILNSFILTTLDAATRIARYILQELFGTLDRYLATALIVLGGGWIALSGEWKKIWPVFGAANQLIAALTLIVISSWLLSRKKHTRYTIVPAVFMLVTTVGALGWQLGIFIANGDWFLVAWDVVLVLLAAAMVVEVYDWARIRMKKGAA